MPHALDTRIIPPGATIGILGDGQLGRMLATAASTLGYRAAILGPYGRDSPAGQVSWWARKWGDPTCIDDGLMREFCSLVSVVLVEWENIPLSVIDTITSRDVPVRSSAQVLGVAQDRSREKAVAARLDIPTPLCHLVTTDDNIRHARTNVPGAGRLKTLRNGYDGKGQVAVPAGGDLRAAWATLGNAPCMFEEHIDYTYELSVIIACSAHESVIYGPFTNVHRDGILRTTHYPAQCTSTIARTAREYARRLADHLGVHGLLAVEYFVTADGRVLFNEMAPRPHNSGHLTIECHHTSQFEQYIRAACNLRLGSAEPRCAGVMQNLIGDEVLPYMAGQVPAYAHLHLYGKDDARPGRKAGHITTFGASM